VYPMQAAEGWCSAVQGGTERCSAAERYGA
jgi:hypothetical protein